MNALIIAANNKENLDWTRGIEGWDLFANALYQPRGREAYSYLNWICTTWNYPNDMVFCQGNPFSHDKDFIAHLDDSSIRHYGEVVECNANGAPHYEAPLHLFCDELGLPKPQTFRFVAGAQYRISRAQLQSQPVSTYHHMMDIAEKEQKSPWIFERLWPVIWNINLST